MGPTHFWPQTHTTHAHDHFEEDPKAFLEAHAPLAPLLNAGDLLLYDARLLHAGGGNSEKERALLYVTFRQELLGSFEPFLRLKAVKNSQKRQESWKKQ